MSISPARHSRLALAVTAVSALTLAAAPLAWGQVGGAVPPSHELAPTPAAVAKPVFVPISPVRLLDTRKAKAPLLAGKARVVTVAGLRGVPAEAIGAELNITLVGATAKTSVTVYPRGASRPATPTVYVSPGQVTANAVTVLLGTGAVTVVNAAGRVHLVVDVLGYQVGHTHDDLYPSRTSPIRLTQSGLDWQAYASDPTAIDRRITRTFATASGRLVMGLQGPASLGGVDYRLSSVTWCLYSMASGSKIDYVEVWADPPASSVASDSTDRTTAGCYTIAVPAVEPGSAYSMDLVSSGGGSFGLATVTTTWVPAAAGAVVSALPVAPGADAEANIR